MATVYGVQNTLAKRTTPPDMIAPNTWNGKVRCSIDVYEANALEAGSTIHTVIIPKGAKILPGSCIYGDDLSADVTLAVGIVGSTGKYLAATVFTTAGQKSEFNLMDVLGVELTAEEEILITTAVSAATGTIKIFVFYVVE